jgi:hypothetical protein
MIKYLKDLWDTFVEAQVRFNRGTVEVRKSRSKSQLTAAPGNLFVVNKTRQKPLSDKQGVVFHSCVEKALYFAKQARLDILPSISFLTTRVKSPDQDDWEKLKHMVEYLHSTKWMPLIMSADGSHNLYWYANSTFGVHKDMKSHTGLVWRWDMDLQYPSHCVRSRS